MDILTLSDLLGEFVKAEKEILNQYNIKHPTTIGAMYDGLTENVFDSTSLYQYINRLCARF
jgi:hypothetical protein